MREKGAREIEKEVKNKRERERKSEKEIEEERDWCKKRNTSESTYATFVNFIQ